MLNFFVEDKRRKQSKTQSFHINSSTENPLSTILFETQDVPYINTNIKKTTAVVEKLPEILDGIKMTTSELPTGKLILCYELNAES